ncbi:hypothetical protein J6590_027970 [Homalodisca vitripennis]|nr:hypothetical protein J6590_027970 [Homalodisca vitripennis]
MIIRLIYFAALSITVAYISITRHGAVRYTVDCRGLHGTVRHYLYDTRLILSVVRPRCATIHLAPVPRVAVMATI